MLQLENLSEIGLLRAYGAIIDELRARGIVRTGNNPIGDYTEWLVARRMQLILTSNSTLGYDATDATGLRYQIKARRIGTQLSAIRNAQQALFDYLIAVIFKRDFTIEIALKIPHSIVIQKARYVSHTNSHTLIIDTALMSEMAVENITHLLVAHDSHESIVPEERLQQEDGRTIAVDASTNNQLGSTPSLRTPLARNTASHEQPSQAYLNRLIQTAGKTNFMLLCEHVLRGATDDQWLMDLLPPTNTEGSKRSILAATRRLISEGYTRDVLLIIQASQLPPETILKATQVLTQLDRRLP